MRIGSKELGSRTYVIAEFGVNHNGSLERAKEGIRKAAEAGADAIKFQTYKADDLVVPGTPKFWNWEGDKAYETQYDAYAAIGGFPYEWYPILFEYCEKLGIEFLSTPFSFEAATFLDSIGMRAFKIASSDMSTLPFLRHVARFNKPILLSTGAAEMDEVKEAVRTIEAEGNDKVAILQCTLKYPTDEADANFGVIQTFKQQFPFNVIGLSDHTMGTFSSIIASAMGASVIEKHFTVDKTLGESADHWLSVDPQELKELVDGVRRVEKLRGMKNKSVIVAEQETRLYDKRSVVAARDIKRGEVADESLFTYKRPGTGIWPNKMKRLLGRRAGADIQANTIITWEHFPPR